MDKETNTQTIVEEKTTVVEVKPIEVRNVVFILFAELLGYVSPLIKWCDKVANNETIPPHMNNIIKIEAQIIYKKMRQKYSDVELREWYDKFYPLVLEDVDEIAIKQELSDLPF